MFIAWCLVCMLCTQKCKANLPGEQNSKGGESIVDDDVMYLFMVRAAASMRKGDPKSMYVKLICTKFLRGKYMFRS